MLKNVLLVVALAIGLLGCNGPAKYVPVEYPVLPEDLKDCKFYNITKGNGSYILVVRCPNSSTAVKNYVDKNPTTSITVEQ